MTSRYALRPNNYKIDRRNQIIRKIHENCIILDSRVAVATQIAKTRQVYLLLNENFDLFSHSVIILDAAYKQMDGLSSSIHKYMENDPTKSIRTCKSALLQFTKYKKMYKNYWANIEDALNTKTCEDMTREILKFIH